MRVQVTGGGFATVRPRPDCRCRVCVQRERAVPCARTCSTVFVHGPDVVVDTPEEDPVQLDRACFSSHRAGPRNDHARPGDAQWRRPHAHVLPEGATVLLGGFAIRPSRLAAGRMNAFELAEGARRLLLAIEALEAWRPPPDDRGADLAVLPMGTCEFDPCRLSYVGIDGLAHGDLGRLAERLGRSASFGLDGLTLEV